MSPGSSDEYYSGATGKVSLAASERQALRERLTPDAAGIVLCMVGLPARGKSFISRKVERFLNWRGFSTKSFNVGMYRRDAVDPERSGRSDYFDAENSTALAARQEAAMKALIDALVFLDDGGKFAILDATNSTLQRRHMIGEKVAAHSRQYSLIFIEALCDDEEVLEANMSTKVQFSPDFKNMTSEQALADLKIRIAKYAEVYEPVQDHEGASIKLFNLSSKVMANHCYGRVAKSILPFLMAIHIGGRPIWLVRAGAGQPPGTGQGSPTRHDRTSRLSEEGRGLAIGLAAFVRRRADEYWRSIGKPQEPTLVITSTMPRAVASVCYTTLVHDQRSALNPVDKGAIGEGWWDVECPSDVPPWKEVEFRHPEFMAQWRKNPVRCHFPGGESYNDIVMRLEGVLLDVEMCTTPVLIVSHVTTLQLLVAYFRGIPLDQAWELPVPRNTVFEVLPTPGGSFHCEEHRIDTSAFPSPEEEGEAPAVGCGGGRTCSVDFEDSNPHAKRQRVATSEDREAAYCRCLPVACPV